MPVVAFLAPSVEGADDQVCVLSDVVALPKDLLGYVQKRVPTYQLATRKQFKANTMRMSAPSTECCPVTSSCIPNQGHRFFRPAQRKLVCVGLGGLSKNRQVKITANRLVMSCNHIQCVASAQACIGNQQTY